MMPSAAATISWNQLSPSRKKAATQAEKATNSAAPTAM